MLFASRRKLITSTRIASIRILASILFIFAGAAFMLPLRAQESTSFDHLQKQHPRLFLHDSQLPAIKKAIATDPFVKQQYQELLAYGNALLDTPPDVYVIGGVEHTLLSTSRDMESRIFALAGLYRFTGDKRYADRATKEMLAAASFPDWYPKHFLDTGEMTAALGLGYDWLYPVLSPADRATIEHAIETKGIDAWMEKIQGRGIPHNNWTQVCNGGETIGALAIADVDPARAAKVIDHARSAIADIMTLFAPDGGFEEGPMYWSYATIYNVLYIDALDSALGTDFGAANATGFSSTGDYHIQSDGPTYVLANFGDAHAGGASPSAQMFWFARRFNKPFYAEHELDIARTARPTERPRRSEHPGRSGRRSPQLDRFQLFLIIWAAQDANMTDGSQLPLVQSFARVDQAYMRSAWNNPDAWYVAFKGGNAHASHGHLDLGSFIMDALGQRWASDPGSDSYGLPGYFGRQRWTYYRMRTEGHNTLTIDGENEDLDSKAPLTASGTMGDSLYAIANLDQEYKGKLTSWSRGIELLDKKRVLVEDEITPAQPVDVVWNFHTFADVKIAADGRSATLTEGGATLHARIVSPAAGRFSTVSTQAPPPNAPNPGLTNLVINLPKQASAETIAVVFTGPGDNTQPALKPLSTWK